MSDPTEEAERRRRREYRITARLLREYTARLYRIGERLSEFLDSRTPASEGGALPWCVLCEVLRHHTIQLHFQSVTLFTSQMLVHYELDTAESNELKLRLADAESANNLAKRMAILIAEEYDIEVDYGEKPKTQTVSRATPAAPEPPLFPVRRRG